MRLFLLLFFSVFSPNKKRKIGLGKYQKYCDLMPLYC